MKKLLPSNRLNCRMATGFFTFALLVGLSLSGYGQQKTTITTIRLLSVSGDKANYQLVLTKPEVPIQTVIRAFKEKSGVVSCESSGENTLLISCDTDITPDMILGVAKNVGCRNTVRFYREELVMAKPAPVKRTESR